MMSLLAAVVLSAAPALEAQQAVAPLAVSAAKKKKKKPKTGAKDKDDDDKPEETSEGLDLTTPDPAPTPEPAPTDNAEPVAPTEEKPAESAPSGWSLVTPRTVGAGGNVLEGGVGWPGVYVGFWRGILPELDVGAKVGFNWGYEGLVTGVLPGLRIQLAAKYLITELGGMPLGVTFQPGFLLYFFRGSGAQPGLVLPLAASLGLPNFVNKLNVSVTLEVPIFVLFNISAVIPIVVGASAEYFITDSLLAFVKLKPAGIALWTNRAAPNYVFEALAGVGFHL